MRFRVVALSGIALAWLCSGVCIGICSGCGATEGPLLHARDAAAPQAGASGDGGGGVAGAGGAAGAAGATATAVPLTIAQDAPWQYQLVGEVDPALEADLFVIDLFNSEEALLAELHARGRLVVAYLSAGTFEPFRSDADEFPEAAIGNPLEAYPDESWLDVRASSVRTLMAARLDRAAQKGFDGVLPTSLTAYESDSGFPLTVADQTAYTTWLGAEIRARGMSAGMSGDFGRSAELAASFDFAVHYGCLASATCTALDTFAAQAKLRLDVEMDGEAAAVCARAAELGINVLIKPDGFGPDRVSCP